MPLDAILSLNGPGTCTKWRGSRGRHDAAFGGAMFVHGIIVDRNEIDKWAVPYIGAAAICTGIGALIGWATDAANSKPHIKFDAPSGGRTKVSVQPVYLRGRGMALAVSFSR